LEDILRVLQQAEGPLKPAQLSKQLKHKSGKAFKPVLDEEARAGRIYSWGSDSYWDKDPKALARERLLNVAKSDGLAGDTLIKRAAAGPPKIAPAIVGQVHEELLAENLLASPRKLARERLLALANSDALDAVALKKRAAEEPPRIKATIVGDVYKELVAEHLLATPKALARERLLNIAKGEFLAASALVERAAGESPKIGSKILTSARTELAKEGLLRVVAKLNVNSQHPELYLQQEIGRLLAEFGVPRSKEQIQALLGPAQVKAPIALEVDGVPEVAEKMFEAMNRIAFAPGTTVTFYRLRQQPELAAIPKAVFDKAALRLQQERRALLAVHDHASRLPQEEQDQFVTDGLGAFYVSIYAV
jgi:hypothetical protein